MTARTEERDTVATPRTMEDYPPPDDALCRVLVDLFARGAAAEVQDGAA